jgi:hypothetical protein
LTFAAISEALGRDLSPKRFDFYFKNRIKREQGERFTVSSVEQDTRPKRETLGLQHGHVLLTHFIGRIHQPLARWIEMKRLDKGGRPVDVMVGGVSGVTGNIVPFGFAKGQIAALAGLNVVGLRRRGVTRATLHRLRKAYQRLFFGDGVFADRADRVAGEFADDPLVQSIVAFVRTGGRRPLMHPDVKREAEDESDA